MLCNLVRKHYGACRQVTNSKSDGAHPSSPEAMPVSQTDNTLPDLVPPPPPPHPDDAAPPTGPNAPTPTAQTVTHTEAVPLQPPHADDAAMPNDEPAPLAPPQPARLAVEAFQPAPQPVVNPDVADRPASKVSRGPGPAKAVKLVALRAKEPLPKPAAARQRDVGSPPRPPAAPLQTSPTVIPWRCRPGCVVLAPERALHYTLKYTNTIIT